VTISLTTFRFEANMSLAITFFIVLALSLAGTLIATALLGIVYDDDDAPEAMTGDDYPNASETADR
jgi:hypothetical protein